MRQPDWFQVHSENALDYFTHHKSLVVTVVAGLVVLGAIVWGWQLFKAKQNLAASQEFTKALELYQSEKYREAIQGFEIVKGNRWSRYAVLAHLYLTNSYLATNDLDKAIAEGQRSVAATDPNSIYRQIALVDLATAEEQKQQCKTAIDHYGEAEKIAGPLQGKALLGKARCAEALGDAATAISAYKEYLKGNPGSPYGVKVAELDAKSTAPGTARK
ncbi:MAG: tetratricopeptide repeat protein [Chloroflexota bacterium]